MIAITLPHAYTNTYTHPLACIYFTTYVQGFGAEHSIPVTTTTKQHTSALAKAKPTKGVHEKSERRRERDEKKEMKRKGGGERDEEKQMKKKR